MIKNIYINEKAFSFNLVNGKRGNSGTVYHLLEDDADLAVKIYHSSIKDNDYPWYPSEADLDYFTKQYQNDSPIMLSQYKVTDSYRKYIGCATPYIYETRGKTKEAIWLLPRDTFFCYFYDLIDTIPYFNHRKISLCDLSIDNIRLGKKGTENKEKLFVFDDSDYSVEDTVTNNYGEINNLIEDMIYYYISQENQLVQKNILQSVRKKQHYIDFLEECSKTSSTMKEAMDYCICKVKR